MVQASEMTAGKGSGACPRFLLPWSGAGRERMFWKKLGTQDMAGYGRKTATYGRIMAGFGRFRRVSGPLRCPSTPFQWCPPAPRRLSLRSGRAASAGASPRCGPAPFSPGSGRLRLPAGYRQSLLPYFSPRQRPPQGTVIGHNEPSCHGFCSQSMRRSADL